VLRRLLGTKRESLIFKGFMKYRTQHGICEKNEVETARNPLFAGVRTIGSRCRAPSSEAIGTQSARKVRRTCRRLGRSSSLLIRLAGQGSKKIRIAGTIRGLAIWTLTRVQEPRLADPPGPPPVGSSDTSGLSAPSCAGAVSQYRRGSLVR
jgi:hypothetical protein